MKIQFMFKLVLVLSLALTIVQPAFARPVPTALQVEVRVNNKIVKFTPGSYVTVSGHAMVPFEQICKQFGADVRWVEKSQKIVVTKGSKRLVFTVNDNAVYINDKKYMVEQAPFINYGTTYVNLRFISKTFGVKLAYTKKPKHIIYLTLPK